MADSVVPAVQKHRRVLTSFNPVVTAHTGMLVTYIFFLLRKPSCDHKCMEQYFTSAYGRHDADILFYCHLKRHHL